MTRCSETNALQQRFLGDAAYYSFKCYLILLLPLVSGEVGKYSGLCDKSSAFHESTLS